MNSDLRKQKRNPECQNAKYNNDDNHFNSVYQGDIKTGTKIRQYENGHKYFEASDPSKWNSSLFHDIPCENCLKLN